MLATASRNGSTQSVASLATESSEEETPGHASLALDFSALFESETVSDVVLDCEGAGGETASVPAHRVVLVAGSTYFASLFSGAWDQSSPGAVVPRHVRVASEEALPHVRLFLAFLYGVDVELTLARAHPLMRLADFYGVDALMTQCLRFLERVLHPQPSRCFSLFDGQDAPSDASGGAAAPVGVPPQERLLTLCTEVLARSFTEASAHSAFRRCPVELLIAVLERDDLSIDKEAELLQVLLNWTAHDSAQRAPHLERLLALVRWPLMEGHALAEIDESHPLLAEHSAPQTAQALRGLLLEAFRYQAASDERRQRLLEAAMSREDLSRRLRPRTPNMVRLQGEGKFCWSLRSFSRLAADERIYSPPFVFSGIAFMLLFFPRGNQQREYASLYVSVADKTKLPTGWRRDIHFSLSVIDQRESLCSVTKSTHGELTTQVLDWGFTELLPLATLHSTNHGYILDDALQFTIQFERITEGASVSGRAGRASASTPPADVIARHVI